MVIFGFCLFLLSAGVWRHQTAELRINNNGLRKHIGEEISLTGFIFSQPSIGEKSTKLLVQAEDLNGKEIKEKILVRTWKYPQYEYGDRLIIIGLLEEPEVFEGFNYREFLAKDNIYALMYFPKIELVDKGSGSLVTRYLFSFKSGLSKSLNKIMPSPQSGLLEGLMFGDEDNISTEWKEKFNLTGTRHITAVSGMNTTIISTLVLGFLLSLGFWRRQAFYLSVIFIFFYILMIGAPASAIRAGIMGALFLTAQHLGRVSSGFRIIVFAGAIMLFLNPLLLKSDVGFQLSFLATLGLVLLQPILSSLFKKIPNIIELRYTLSATLAAQFFALPILIYNFGQVPLIGPLANVLIVPLLVVITILGFIFSFLGMILYPLGQILSFPAWFLLTYIFKVIDFSSKIPHATLSLENIPWIFIFTSYLFLGVVVWRLQEKDRLKLLQ